MAGKNSRKFIVRFCHSKIGTSIWPRCWSKEPLRCEPYYPLQLSTEAFQIQRPRHRLPFKPVSLIILPPTFRHTFVRARTGRHTVKNAGAIIVRMFWRVKRSRIGRGCRVQTDCRIVIGQWYMIGGLGLAAVAVVEAWLIGFIQQREYWRCACVHVDSLCVCKKGTLVKFTLAWRELHASARSLNLSTGFPSILSLLFLLANFLGLLFYGLFFWRLLRKTLSGEIYSRTIFI